MSSAHQDLDLALTLFRMGLFKATHGWREGKKAFLPKISNTYPTVIKLGTVVHYLEKIQKTYKPCHTPLEF